MMFSIASSQANAQDWGGVVGGLAGGMIAGAIIANQQPRYVYVPVRQHYYTPRHRAVAYARPVVSTLTPRPPLLLSLLARALMISGNSR